MGPGNVNTRDSKGGKTKPSITVRRTYLSTMLGSLGGAAVGVLMNVHAGVPPGGPLVAPTIGALAGGAALHWLPARTLASPIARIIGFGLLILLVGIAVVYVVAAVALSNFE